MRTHVKRKRTSGQILLYFKYFGNKFPERYASLLHFWAMVWKECGNDWNTL
jgi:hypothetical protein